jgi:hypothetical protein
VRPREEGWPRQRPGWSLTSNIGASDHPVCGSTVGFAEIFLMPQRPLLVRRGLLLPQILSYAVFRRSAFYGRIFFIALCAL